MLLHSNSTKHPNQSESYPIALIAKTSLSLWSTEKKGFHMLTLQTFNRNEISFSIKFYRILTGIIASTLRVVIPFYLLPNTSSWVVQATLRDVQHVVSHVCKAPVIGTICSLVYYCSVSIVHTKNCFGFLP